jgi:hypothetical protein
MAQANQALYLNNPFTANYIANVGIGSNARQDQVDHAWHNILRDYFFTPNYAVERESYLDPNGLSKANVAVINNRNGGHHKVLVVEAIRPGNAAPTDHEWTRVREQLQTNMLRARIANGNVQTMYGIAAIGRFARMYALSMVDNLRGRLEPVIDRNPLSLDLNSLEIERRLLDIRNTINQGRNTY